MEFFDETKESIRDSILADVQESIPQITSFAEGGVMRGFVEIVADYLYQVYQEYNTLVLNAFVQTASGSWLDDKCTEIGLTRNPGVAAEGFVVFSRNQATNTPVSIPQGTLVETKPNSQSETLLYEVMADSYILENATDAQVRVQATDVGTAYNVAGEQITVLPKPLQGVDQISNENDWLQTSGLDKEMDDALKERYFLKWQELSGANASAYESWAMSVEGVDEAVVLDIEEPGLVNILIRGEGSNYETSASEELIASVQTVVDEKKPIGTQAVVSAAFTYPCSIQMNVYVYAGTLEEDISRIQIQTIEAIDAYIKVLPIGSDVIPSNLIRSLPTDSMVYEYALQYPVDRIAIDQFHTAVVSSEGHTVSVSETSEL